MTAQSFLPSHFLSKMVTDMITQQQAQEAAAPGEEANGGHVGKAKLVVGCLIAIMAGLVLNVGNIVQKKAVNDILQRQIKNSKRLSMSQHPSHKSPEIKLGLKDLLGSKMWILGFILQALMGAGLSLVAQAMIGPTLTPILGSVGLVVLVFASCIVQEALSWYEYIGLVILLGAVVLLAFTGMEINIEGVDLLASGFLIRVVVYTAIVVVLCIFCKLWSFRKDKLEGTVLGTLSGLLVALQNYWISPMTSIGEVLLTGKHYENDTFEHHSSGTVYGYFVIALVIVIISNLLTVYERQLAFKVGNAATVIPISHIPSHLSSPAIYAVFNKTHMPNKGSIFFMWGAIFLLLVSSFIFGRRGAMIEEEHIENIDENKPLIVAAGVDINGEIVSVPNPMGLSDDSLNNFADSYSSP